MYVSAQRVCSRTREGVNAFLSLHSEAQLGDLDWNSPPLEKIIDEQPGVLVSKECDLPAGGNHVRSFLDVVARDQVPVEQIKDALRTLSAAVAASPVPFHALVAGVAVRFDADGPLFGERAEEYELLARRILRLLESWWTRAPASAAE